MFEFGWGFWVLFFVIFFGCGRMCGWGARKYRERHRDIEPGHAENDRLTNLESRVKQLDARDRERSLRPTLFRRGERQTPEPAMLKRKSRLEELQQKFVEGRLSLTDYERELDRLERIE